MATLRFVGVRSCVVLLMLVVTACTASSGSIGSTPAGMESASATEPTPDRRAAGGDASATPTPDNSDVTQVVSDTFEGPIPTGTSEPFRNGTPCERPWQRGAIASRVLKLDAGLNAASVVRSLEESFSITADLVAETDHYGMGYASFGDLRVWFEIDDGSIADVPASGIELVGPEIGDEDLATIAAKYVGKTWDEIDASQPPTQTNNGPIAQSFIDIENVVSFVVFPAGNQESASVCLFSA